MFRFQLLKHLWAIYFFIRSDQIKMVRPLRQRPNSSPISSLSSPVVHKMDHVPLRLKWPVICSPASLKERKLCFCHWFSQMKLISLPSSGSEAAVSKSAISLCFVPVSAGEILNSLCTKLFKFCIILKLCFFGVGAHWPSHLAVRARYSLGWQCADL